METAAALPVATALVPGTPPTKPAGTAVPSGLGAANGLGGSAAAPPATPPPAHQPGGCWKAFFSDWPADLPRRGVVITQLNEPIAFKAFMMRGEFTLLERTSPDSMGGRFLLVPFAEIAVVKFTDPLKQPVFDSAGFKGKLSS